jgi:hypothetical protein
MARIEALDRDGRCTLTRSCSIEVVAVVTRRWLESGLGDHPPAVRHPTTTTI